MFNVSALLLDRDDKLKPSTPLTNGVINETLRHTLYMMYEIFLINFWIIICVRSAYI